MFHFDFTTAKASIRENVPPFYRIRFRIRVRARVGRHIYALRLKALGHGRKLTKIRISKKIKD